MATTRISRGDSKARTRADLIAAARRVFLARGFHAATLDEIAEEAGYTKGAVYSNFEGKDDLFLAVLTVHYAQRAASYAVLVGTEEDSEAMFRRVARVMLDAYREEPAWWPLISDFSTHASRHPALNARLRDAREGFLDELAGQIEALGEHHRLTLALPAREVARGTGALMRGMAVEWAIDPAAADAGAFEEMVAAYLRGLAVPRPERSSQ
jgi:AcrR family transcriptional regulator